MNYEQKYKEALERAKKQHSRTIIANLPGDREKIEEIFPELRESEEQRIRKEIVDYLKKFIPHHDCDLVAKSKGWIAWLEKQGEKKDTVIPQWMIDFLKEHRRNFATPMDYDEKKETDGKLISVIKWLEGNPQLEQKPSWSEEDKNMLLSIINDAEQDALLDKEQINWLKSLKDRVQPQPKQEWGEEDEKMFDKLYEIFYRYGYSSHPEIDLSSNEAINLIHWLKSLKSKKHWKPSEEQMEALKYFISFHEDHARSLTTKWEEFKNLESLYNDLKNL